MSSGWKRLSALPSHRITGLQDARLNRFISDYLYPFSPFYRKLFDRLGIKPGHIRTRKDLSRIPFISKQDFLPTKENPAKFLDFLLRPERELVKRYWPKIRLLDPKLKSRLEEEFRPIFMTTTAGTTGQPVSFLYTAYDIQNLRISGERLIELFEVEKNSRALNLFPYAPHLAFWQVIFAGLSKRILILSTGGGKVVGTEGNLRAIEKLKPNFLVGLPGYIYHVLREAHSRKMDLSFIERIVLGASRVPSGFKEKLTNFLSKKDGRIFIMGTYGFTEARCAWGECPTEIGISSGYHTYPDKEIFEIIDPETGETKSEGEDGEIVYTNIDSRGTCVLRFRTGDYAKGGITYKVCPYCKRTVPRISSDITRLWDIKELKLTKIKGSLVNLNTFAEVLNDSKEVLEWQIEIRKKDDDPYEVDELILYLSVAKGVDCEALKKKIAERVLVETEVSFNQMQVLPLNELVQRIEIESAMKEKRIVDKRPTMT